MSDADKALVARLWTLLYERDFDGVGALFAPDGQYTDVPTPPEDVAIGPAMIAARLRLGLEPLASIGHTVRLVVADGDVVVTEHTEHWEWPTGERADLPFVSVHEVRDGMLVRWWDYWDMGTLLGAAPQWWLDHIMEEAARAGLR